ncbi:EAL domain-containing protein [Dactylosporangium roseum]|uniref:EAL domain-containing protein n=1 Tax=Dactylosporangium roseum TaxID=47989 RepID=A0ABY5YV17_9ACTN|nr:EAL domain-containing protein [Dactylosporangium roseum]UWZ33580.1 EAL domain-containing protein [Dactylosporangium roseum]
MLSWLGKLLRTAAPTRGHAVLCAVVAAVTVTLFAAFVTGLGGQLVARNLSNVALFAGALTAAWGCLVRAWGADGHRVRWAWALVGLGNLSWGVGQMFYIWYETVLGTKVPFPSLADAGYFWMMPLTAAGLLLLPMSRQSVAQQARSILDGLMIAASLLLITWVLILGPLVAQGADGSRVQLVNLWYPASDVVVLTVVLVTLARVRRGGPRPMSLPLIGGGLAAFTVSDSGYAYLTLTDSYGSGAVLDVGWFAGFALILLAARRPGTGAAAEDPRALTRPLGVMLPYLAVLGSLVTSTVDVLRHGMHDSFVSWTRSAIILLIVGRQLLTLLENRSLTRDLEARVEARTAQLRASEQRFQALVQHSSDVVSVIDRDGIVSYQSESLERVFGYDPKDAIGQRLPEIMNPEAGTRLREAIDAISGTPYATQVIELPVRHADGHACVVEVTMTNLLGDDNVRGIVLNSRDISERRKLEDQLVHEAFHDGLTKLANRALFKDRVEAALRRRGDGEVAVLFLDLDGFKEVNDSLGHAAGDTLLVRVASRLGDAVRPGDTVARFGGDEFAVLVDTVTDAGAADELAARIIDTLDEHFLIDNQEIHVQGSIGIALTGPDAQDADQLMRNADLAMYRAKSAGSGLFARYDPQMHSGLVERLQLAGDLRRALDNGDELKLHYQPTIELRTGDIVGFEALVRWRHPVRGMIPPADFIDLAESTGLIRPLGQWVLAEACRQAVEWGGDKPLTMAVNVSGRQFDQPDLPQVVASVLAETGLPADRLCLEMTESVLMTDTEENLAVLLSLKEIGVRLAIDDFGTGYSSLAYLRRFPVDTLKIDRSFVERLSGTTPDAALARTIVRLGQSLGMATVAEGIEQYAQFLALRRMGCDLGQGYYFARPLPAEEAAALLRDPAAVPA